MAKPRSEEAIKKAEERKKQRENEDLLLRDLCARLPYGVKIHYTKHPYSPVDEDADDTVQGYYFNIVVGNNGDYCLDRCKPYLRPMSSMTEEEVKEFNNLVGYEEKDEWIRCNNICGSYGINIIGCSDMIDWLNAHHFDYRGLIEKGLAIEVTEENNPYN